MIELDGTSSPPPAAMSEERADEAETAENPALALWWNFACEEDELLRAVARWESVPTPTARDLATKDTGLAAARAALAEHRQRGEVLERECATPVDEPERTPDAAADDLAELFDPVTVAELETMLPTINNKQWAKWAERASDNGLKAAAWVARGRYNPYRAAMWFLRRGAPGWDQAHIYRVLGNNLPPRSRDQREWFMLASEE